MPLSLEILCTPDSREIDSAQRDEQVRAEGLDLVWERTMVAVTETVRLAGAR